MLHEKVCTRIVESIPVSKAIEGKLSLIEGTHRSRIRPFPPQLKLQKSELTYGLCVDALTGSWREGVVVDQKNYSTAKLIFFPDRCDECWVPSHQLRLTQDWDEISGNWRRRGEWLFLQIIKEMHKVKIALPELRQVWFQLKSMAEFRENIKLWFSGSKFMWRGLLSDVIEGKWSPVISSTATQSSTDVVVTGKCSIEREGTSSSVWRLSPESNDFSTKCPNRI
ncbi:hypothetical protein HPP92_013335 [Vanilla planifolia]|uniref:Uncharacterized protein n=1 Tax=Vanilla planifolia TaxID=51239 RepID=A0A835V0I6_VANPL|nr:hypothetical protein HPP92_013335 [Vanilla planifolia]